MTPVTATITAAFAAAGVDGWLHAVDIDDDRALSVGGDTTVAMASVFKVPVLVALHRAADTGLLELTERVRVTAAGRTPGVTGIGSMRDDADLSLRDLAHLMITVSDNAAADAVLDRLGLDAVNAALADLGVRNTVVRLSCRALHDLLAADLAARGTTMPEALADLTGFHALDPVTTNQTTPRDMTALLTTIWRNRAATAPACGEMRRTMRLQVWPHRLAAGFPADDIRVAGKTGTLLTLRSEIGVVEYPDGGRFTVAVFTRSRRDRLVDPGADAVIGAAARHAVDHLRQNR